MSILKPLIVGAVALGSLLIIKRVMDKNDIKDDIKKEKEKPVETRAETERRRAHDKINHMTNMKKKHKDMLKDLWEKEHIVKVKKEPQMDKDRLRTALADAFMKAQKKNNTFKFCAKGSNSVN